MGGGITLGGYSVAEPWRLRTTRYAVSPPGWPQGLRITIAALADIHACEPWMGLSRLEEIVARTNALAPDVVVLLGDFVAGHRLGRMSQPVSKDDIAATMAGLKAPLGTYAILGNHDWWDDLDVQRRRAGPPLIGRAIEAAGIPVLENAAVRLESAGRPFWIAGLGDQWAFWSPRGRTGGRFAHAGIDDLDGTLARISDDAPVVLLAHEPDVFVDVPSRVALTLAGHTHGGQITLAGYAPIVPSRFGRRYVYGHVVEEGRNLIVSGGLGCSGLPIRLGRPPEIVLVEVSA